MEYDFEQRIRQYAPVIKRTLQQMHQSNPDVEKLTDTELSDLAVKIDQETEIPNKGYSRREIAAAKFRNENKKPASKDLKKAE